MDQADEYDAIYKVILVGDQGTGKSNLMLRFTRDQYDEGIKSTVGVEFATRNLTIDGKRIRCQTWDTAGQERFRAVTKAYYRGAQGALLAYDITRRETFEGAKRWLSELRLNADPKAVIVLVGNKSDMAHIRQVPTADGEELSRAEHLLFMETSARTSTNVEAAFTQVLRHMHRQQAGRTMDAGGQATSAPLSSGSRIDLARGKSSRSGCCSG